MTESGQSPKETESKDGSGASNGTDSALRPDLTSLEVHHGTHRGDTYIRVVRSDSRLLKRVAPGYLRATAAVSRPSGKFGRAFMRLKEILVGRTLPSEAEKEERLTKIKALAVFSSDAISSSAYATEEILIVLVAAGSTAIPYALPAAFAIAILLAVVSFSYRQTVHAYPHGGGSYTVSRENLGTQLGLIAAAALLIDYVLTVAVSIAAGTAAITSAVPDLFPYRVSISLAFIVLITVVNLRGIRESGTIFALPTYLFILSLTAVIFLGVFRIFSGLGPAVVLPHEIPAGDDRHRSDFKWRACLQTAREPERGDDAHVDVVHPRILFHWNDVAHHSIWHRAK